MTQDISGPRRDIDEATLNIARLEERVVSNEQELLGLLREAHELEVKPEDLGTEAERIFKDVNIAVQSVQADIAKMKVVTDA